MSLKVLVACEFSGRVRDAFIRRGHHAVSCDILPSDSPGPHIQGDIREVDFSLYGLVIAFPPCTRLCVSGARWWKDKQEEQRDAIEFFLLFTKLTVPYAIENPIGIMSRVYRTPDQIIQPYQFGHGETKSTCLWLNKLPRLTPTSVVAGRENRIHRMGPSKNRSKLRSLTYPGIADAMADQWGSFLDAPKPFQEETNESDLQLSLC